MQIANSLGARDSIHAVSKPAAGPLESAQAANARPRTNGKRNRMGRNGRLAWALFAPSLILVGCVTLYPIVRGVSLSLHETEFLQQLGFVGFDNYKRFFVSGDAGPIIVRTIVFAIGSLALTFPIAIALALLLNTGMRFRTLLRTLLMLPWIVSQLLTALMWAWMVDGSVGPLSWVLSTLSDSYVVPLGSGPGAMLTLIVANAWRTYPYAMILTLAALQTVDRQLLEAAAVDGAGRIGRFLHVTLPAIKGSLLVSLIILTVNAINMVELPLVMTGGGPVSATELLGLVAYNEAFTLNHFGYSAAIGTTMFVINIAITVVYVRVMRTESDV
jgi:multiple sugar transport system permease protein